MLKLGKCVRTIMKTGRNAPCPCGSGRKHKKCCMGKGMSAAPVAPSNAMSADETLARTQTGEIVQLVRLFYRVPDKGSMARALEQLQCVEIDHPKRRWVWLYRAEAKELGFARSYSSLPKHLHPIIIGAWRLASETEMCLDLRSIERAMAAVQFFDSRVDRSVAEFSDAAVLNRVFSIGDLKVTDDDFQDAFSPDRITMRDTQELFRAAEKTSATRDPLKRVQAAFETLESIQKRAFPECERFPVHYYEDGLEGFSLSLKTRQSVAVEHWKGNKEFTAGDFFERIFPAPTDGVAKEATP